MSILPYLFTANTRVPLSVMENKKKALIVSTGVLGSALLALLLYLFLREGKLTKPSKIKTSDEDSKTEKYSSGPDYQRRRPELPRQIRQTTAKKSPLSNAIDKLIENPDAPEALSLLKTAEKALLKERGRRVASSYES